MKHKTSSRKIAFSIILLVVGMTMLTFAAVPIYNLFCKVTGYGGTTKYTSIASTRVGTKMMKVRFDANVASDLPWSFKSEQNEVTIKVGENNLVFYSAENKTDKPIIGTAIYNVTPHKAGAYFNKIQCFCFEEQLLKPNQKMIMPVSFFIDPAIEDDKNLQDVDTITLSYTFYPIREN
ncbi:MAG: cytochrome c oxidase assembly protein [Rickettsiales bacterium]|nr:cytochrome c oxidase assembly protein [Rickettsiales bacterium]